MSDDPLGCGARTSTFTLELRKGVSATLPFEDECDFEEAKKGFLAEPSYQRIMADAGNIAWDMASYQWLLKDENFPSIHPSLQRQAVLNMAYGLYEVVPGKVYQVRGVVEEADVASGKVKVIASEGFMQAAIEENVFAGNAMSRRTQWQYAVLLPLSPQDSAPLYVEMMGGSAKIIAKGRQLVDAGKYREASEILNKLVFAEPQNQPARRLRADAYEQLGYQAESTSVRNSFL